MSTKAPTTCDISDHVVLLLYIIHNECKNWLNTNNLLSFDRISESWSQEIDMLCAKGPVFYSKLNLKCDGISKFHPQHCVSCCEEYENVKFHVAGILKGIKLHHLCKTFQKLSCLL